MPGSRKQPQGSLCMRECLGVATLAIKQPRHRTMGMRLTDMVGEASVKIQCLQQVLLRIAVALHADVGISEAAMGNRLTAKTAPRWAARRAIVWAATESCQRPLRWKRGVNVQANCQA